MKKILLSALALVATLSVNAQEYAAFNADENAEFAALGLSSDAISLAGGTVIGKTDNITFMIGADDSYKSSSIGTITVGDAKINGGIQGSNNPKDVDGNHPANTLNAPVGGAYFEVEAAEDGFLYVFQNSSSNKAYLVFEEGEAIGYTFSAYCGKEKYPTGKGVYGYELKGDGEYNQLKAAGITSVLWPEQYIMGDAYDIANTPDSKGYGDGGLGVIKFPVFAGCKYIVSASGSKMTASGFYFDKKGDATITIKVDDADVTILDKGQIPGGSDDPVIPVTKGDANGDGTVNAADIVEIVNYIMGSASDKFNEAAADVNGDGVVNAADIVAVVNIIMAGN